MLLFARRSSVRRVSRTLPRRRVRSGSLRFQRPQLEVLEDRTLPSTLTVTNLTDSAAATMGDGSLRGEIKAAQNGDTIVFQQGLSGTITLASGAGPLSITKGITIQGPGAGSLTISGNNNQVFDVAVSGGDVTLSGLTISGGSATNGGGVLFSGGNLTINGCDFSSNTAAGGKGGAVDATGSSGSVSLVNDTFENNSSANGGAVASTLGLTVTGCTFLDNIAGTSGGSGGALSVTNATASIDSSTFSDNQAQSTALESEAAGGAVFGGALSKLIVTSSTFSGNEAVNKGFAVGGGLYVGGTLSLTNSTVTENQAQSTAGASADGGGLFIDAAGSATITSGTFASNSVSFTSGGGGKGGGIDNAGTLTLDNTIVASNSVTSGGSGPDLFGAITSQGYNLIGDSSGGSGYDGSTDQLDVNPMLGSLASNGGPTQTLALLAGSPALGAGDPALIGTTDQRGVTRYFTDIGAYNTYYGPTNLTISANPSALLVGQTTQLQGSFTDHTPEAAHTVDINWGDGTADTILSLDIGVFSFTATHAFRANSTITATVSAAGTPPASAATTVTVTATAPQIQAGDDVVLGLGTALVRTGSFSDPGASSETVQVNYGDSNAVQTVALAGNQTFTLQHVYASEGSYQVTVTLTDSNGATVSTNFIVNMMLPGTTNTLTAEVPPGSVQTASAPGVSMTLFHSPFAPQSSLILAANVSNETAAALASLPWIQAGVPTAMVSYDVRAINVVEGDVAIVTFQYPSNGAGPPMLLFFNRATGTYEPVVGSSQFPGSVFIDPSTDTITLVLDISSFPSVLSLTGTVFTIAVPVAVPFSLNNSVLIYSSMSNANVTVESSSSSSPSSSSTSFLVLSRLTSGMGMADGVDDPDLDALVLLDLPQSGSSAILLPTVTLSPSQAGLLQLEEENKGAPLPPDAPILSVPPEPPPKPAPEVPPGPSTRSDQDLKSLDRLFALVTAAAAEEPAVPPVEGLLPGRSLEAALLVSGGLFCLGFEIVPVGTHTERRRLQW